MRAIFLLLTMLLGAATCTKTASEAAIPLDLAPAPAPPGDKWVEKLVRSEMDDGVQVMLTVTADNEIDGPDGIKVAPKLTFGCKEPPYFMMKLRAEVPLDLAGVDGSDFGPEIKIRLDDKSAKTERWVASEDGELTMPVVPLTMVRELANSQTVKIQFKPFHGEAVVARFDVRRLGKHIPFLKQCKAALR